MSEPSVQHFRNIITSETQNLTRLCEYWSKILEEHIDDEHEDFLGAIRSTIGQAKLLMSQRFKQFSDLIDHCEFKTGPMPTRLDDLSGFWEMISLQVKDVIKKYEVLDARRQDLMSIS